MKRRSEKGQNILEYVIILSAIIIIIVAAAAGPLSNAVQKLMNDASDQVNQAGDTLGNR